jgi:hypothetical protein
MTVFKVINKGKRGSLKCKFILSAFLNPVIFPNLSAVLHLRLEGTLAGVEDYLPEALSVEF